MYGISILAKKVARPMPIADGVARADEKLAKETFLLPQFFLVIL